MIRVLVIDDSFFVRKVLEKVLFCDGEIEVVGEASNGEEGIKKIVELNPDVVCLDIVMPREDGTLVLEKIFKYRPTPVVVVSLVSTPISEITRNLLELGMIEVIQKPDSPEKFAFIAQELIKKIKAAAKLKTEDIREAYQRAVKTRRTAGAKKLLVIGCPVSKPVALEDFLVRLPKFMTAGVLVQVFMHTQFIDHWINRIKQSTMLSGKLAEEGDIIIPGRVLFSPNDKAIEVRKLTTGGVVHLVDSDKIEKDYIDTMFESAAKSFRENIIAVILSEIASDGIEGLKAVKAAGGKTFIETYENIPGKFNDGHLADAVIPLADIAEKVSRLISQ